MAEFLIESDPRSISPSQYRTLFTRFLEKFEYNQVENLLLKSTRGDKDDIPCGLHINIQDLILFDSALAFTLLHYPSLLLPLFNEAAIQIQREIWNHEDFKIKNEKKIPFGGVKIQVQIRISPLPPLPAFTKSSIGDLRAECGGGGGEGKGSGLVQIIGTIVRTGSVRMLEQSKEYQCQNPQCLFQFTVYADPEQDNMLPQPRSCPRLIMTGRGGGRGEGGRGGRGGSIGGRGSIKRCNCPNIREIESSRVCVDYQEIKVQDPMEQLGLGASPRSIAVVLQADLVDQFNPGDKVIIIGTLIRQWRSLVKGIRSHIEIVLLANNIVNVYEQETDLMALSVTYSHFRAFWRNFNRFKKNSDHNLINLEEIDHENDENEDENYENYDLESALSARDFIIRAVCPQLYGMFLVKLSLLLSLIGGVEGEYKGGNRRRSEIHMLMVGDPGCGKSQLLRFAASLLPRSVITTGIGTTGAGLTCTAVRESGNRNGGGGEWSLEAGALVLANGGVCCIDEFSGIKETDRATIHEAMEQQTISIAKAGLVVRLVTRTTVVACCNPKGSFDLSADLTTNTAISSPLLSRFDIILVMIDSPNKDWDKRVSTFLLYKAVSQNTKYNKENPVSNNVNNINHSNRLSILSGKDEDSSERQKELEREKEQELINSLWNVQTLRQYISVIKVKLKPVMSDEAKLLLMRFYYLQRNSESSSQARTTVRLLESLIRIAEAHAKLMFRRKVLIIDAVMSIYISSFSQMKMISLLSSSNLNNSFLSFERIKDDFSSSSSSSAYDYYLEIEKEIFIRLNYSKERLKSDIEKKNSRKKFPPPNRENREYDSKDPEIVEIEEFDNLTNTFEPSDEWSRGPFPPIEFPTGFNTSSSSSSTTNYSDSEPPTKKPPHILPQSPNLPTQPPVSTLSSYFMDSQPSILLDSNKKNNQSYLQNQKSTNSQTTISNSNPNNNYIHSSQFKYNGNTFNQNKSSVNTNTTNIEISPYIINSQSHNPPNTVHNYQSEKNTILSSQKSNIINSQIEIPTASSNYYLSVDQNQNSFFSNVMNYNPNKVSHLNKNNGSFFSDVGDPCDEIPPNKSFNRNIQPINSTQNATLRDSQISLSNNDMKQKPPKSSVPTLGSQSIWKSSQILNFMDDDEDF